MKPVLWHVGWLVLAAWAAVDAQQYKLSFSRTSSRTSWRPSFPSWNYSTPVRFSAVGDTTSKLTINASASMGFTLDDRSSGKSWQDNASGRSSINYPILGPKATISLGASMSTRNVTLQKQKVLNRSFNFGFRSKPLSSGPFKSLNVSLTPGLVKAARATRANIDNTIRETGIRYSARLGVSPDIEIAGKKLNNSISLSKADDTLEHNKNRSESLSSSVSYTFPGEVRVSLSFSENRSQQGLTRRVISEDVVGEAVMRDTMVSPELLKRRGTSLSPSVGFDIGRFKIKNSISYSQRENTNTANAAQDDLDNNRHFGTDRLSENFSWNSSLSGKLVEKLVLNTSFSFKSSDLRRLAVRADLCPSHFTRSADGTCRDPSSDQSNHNLFLNGSLTWPLADAHSLRLTTYGEIKRSENPGKPDQDHDVFNNSVSFRYDGTLRSGAKLSVDLKNSFLHRVNLHAKRAGDNSRNRNISLDISTNYERLGASFSHRFGVSARRTIYDFDRQINKSSRKSKIRRGWSMGHTLRRKIIDALALNASYNHSAGDDGTLILENGAQIVEEENAQYSVRFGMTYSPSAAYSASANYRYRLDRQWAYLGQSRSLKRGSPNRHRTLSANFNYNPVGSKNKLTLGGSRTYQRSRTYNSLSVSYTRSL